MPAMQAGGPPCLSEPSMTYTGSGGHVIRPAPTGGTPIGVPTTDRMESRAVSPVGIRDSGRWMVGGCTYACGCIYARWSDNTETRTTTCAAHQNQAERQDAGWARCRHGMVLERPCSQCDQVEPGLPPGCKQHDDLADWCSVHDQDGSVCRKQANSIWDDVKKGQAQLKREAKA